MKTFCLRDKIKVINPITDVLQYTGTIIEINERLQSAKVLPDSSTNLMTAEVWPFDWIKPINIKDERDVFEQWFRFTYGNRPEGNLSDLKDELESIKWGLESRIYTIEKWETAHKAALAAWHERHNRK